jgi:hypothetical protein
MTKYKEYTDQSLIFILKRLNEDFEKEKTIEEPVPTIIEKTYNICINQIETELKSRGIYLTRWLTQKSK